MYTIVVPLQNDSLSATVDDAQHLEDTSDAETTHKSTSSDAVVDHRPLNALRAIEVNSCRVACDIQSCKSRITAKRTVLFI